MRRLEADVAVVGLGPAGVAAAVSAAEVGASVLALDEGGAAGGQIWRHRTSDRGRLPLTARGWLDRLDAQAGRRVTVLPSTAVVEAVSPFHLRAVSRGGREDQSIEVGAKAIVLATGARERFLPFPGWTLPGVMGVGGAQALVKSGASVAGLRVVVAGSGPLLLPVAATLTKAGARLTEVAEQASAGALAGFAASLLLQPKKLVEGARYRLAFASARYRTGHWIARALGTERLEAVRLTDGRQTFDVPCEMLACGFGLVPNLEVARHLGCGVADGAVAVDEDQRTSVPSVFAAGETCGVGGVDLALTEGAIAGRVAASADVAPGLRAERARGRAFARRLERAFALRAELRALAEPETVVCRCEDVPLNRLRADWSPRQAKLYTRTGMGPCQGRVCATALEFLFGWPADTVRPPLSPVPFDALKEDES